MFLRTFLLLLVLASQPIVGFAAVWVPAGSDMAAQEQMVTQDHCSDAAMDLNHGHSTDGDECQLQCQTCGSCAGMFMLTNVAQAGAVILLQSRRFAEASPAGPPHEQLYRPPIIS